MKVRPIRILMVDDSPWDRELARLALRNLKVANELDTAEDGEQALEILRDAEAPRPDLILMDLNMPGMDGRELLAALKEDELLKAIPVVILTSSAADEDVSHAYSHHCAGYIRKPVDMEGLITIAQAIEGYWFAIVQLP